MEAIDEDDIESISDEGNNSKKEADEINVANQVYILNNIIKQNKRLFFYINYFDVVLFKQVHCSDDDTPTTSVQKRLKLHKN